MSTSTAETERKNREITWRFTNEVWNERRIETVYELLSPNIVAHYEFGEIHGPDEWKRNVYDKVLAVFPDLSLTSQGLVTSGDLAFMHWEGTGTMAGEMYGVPPINKKIEFEGLSWVRLAEGKLVDIRNHWNIPFVLQHLVEELKMLRGIIPLCAICKKVRDEKGYWEQVEVYLQKFIHADVSHGLCPECIKTHYPELQEDDK